MRKTRGLRFVELAIFTFQSDLIGAIGRLVRKKFSTADLDRNVKFQGFDFRSCCFQRFHPIYEGLLQCHHA
jgi:hypothetical protein